MTFSVIIPAYNEEKALPQTLEHVRKASDIYRSRVSGTVEVILVDNGSTDSTRSIAEEFGVRVVTEEKRQIARVRNRGAESARGQMLLFCDADTQVHPETLSEIGAHAKDEKLIGGGIQFVPDESKPLYRIGLSFWELFSKCFQVSGGTLFCRKDAFDALGGFPEKFYVGEEVLFQTRMKIFAWRNGKKTLLLRNCPAVTSMRKFREYGLWSYSWAVFRCFLFPWLATRKKYCNLWYDVRKS